MSRPVLPATATTIILVLLITIRLYDGSGEVANRSAGIWYPKST